MAAGGSSTTIASTPPSFDGGISIYLSVSGVARGLAGPLSDKYQTERVRVVKGGTANHSRSRQRRGHIRLDFLEAVRGVACTLSFNATILCLGRSDQRRVVDPTTTLNHRLIIVDPPCRPVVRGHQSHSQPSNESASRRCTNAGIHTLEFRRRDIDRGIRGRGRIRVS